MSVFVLKNSRLQFSTLLTASGIEFWDLPEYPDLPAQYDDLQYMVQDQDRIDTLAFNFYGDPTYWWLIAYANNIELVPTELYEGQVLRIPSPRWVKASLFGSQNKK